MSTSNEQILRDQLLVMLAESGELYRMKKEIATRLAESKYEEKVRDLCAQLNANPSNEQPAPALTFVAMSSAVRPAAVDLVGETDKQAVYSILHKSLSEMTSAAAENEKS